MDLLPRERQAHRDNQPSYNSRSNSMNMLRMHLLPWPVVAGASAHAADPGQSLQLVSFQKGSLRGVVSVNYLMTAPTARGPLLEAIVAASRATCGTRIPSLVPPLYRARPIRV